ncbi:MBL fold metallo-hydrolase [bacterium]|nr:MBL fold metallo-hydrolase [bacterium]
MIIKQYIAGPIDANNYLVADEASKEAVLIDCSDRVQKIIGDVKNLGLNVKYILFTHGHFDHVMGANVMKEELGAKVLGSKEDLNQTELTKTILQSMGLPLVEDPKYDEFIDKNSQLKIGDTEIKVIETPGHTEGGLCFLIENNLFSGDTLFKGCVGRTDLPGGSFAKLENSIKNKLYKLDDLINVHPGHGDMTTIYYEKKYNEIVR